MFWSQFLVNVSRFDQIFKSNLVVALHANQRVCLFYQLKKRKFDFFYSNLDSHLVCCQLCLSKLIIDFGLYFDTCRGFLKWEKLAVFRYILVFVEQLYQRLRLVSMFLIFLAAFLTSFFFIPFSESFLVILTVPVKEPLPWSTSFLNFC